VESDGTLLVGFQDPRPDGSLVSKFSDSAAAVNKFSAHALNAPSLNPPSGSGDRGILLTHRLSEQCPGCSLRLRSTVEKASRNAVFAVPGLKSRLSTRPTAGVTLLPAFVSDKRDGRGCLQSRANCEAQPGAGMKAANKHPRRFQPDKVAAEHR
jgi:hypothetical protein